MIDPLVGQFCFYFAMFGGFNYVSRELGETRPYQSFYNPGNESIPNYKEFIDDINTLTARDGAWAIATITASGGMEPEYPEEIHIQYGAAKGDSSFNADNLLVHDFAKAEAIFSDIEARMQEIGIVTERQQRHKSDNPAIFLRKLEHAETLNSFILRIAWSAMSWNPNHLKIAQTIANTLHEQLEPERELDLSELKLKDIGYRGYRI